MALSARQIAEQKRQAEELLFAGPEHLGFAKSLFFGQFKADHLFPYPVLPPAEKATVDEAVAKVRAFCEQSIDPAAIDRAADIPRSVIDGLAGIGVLGMTGPKEYGGLGFSQQQYCKVLEVLGGHDASVAVFVNAHGSIGIRALLLFGTEEQKRPGCRACAAARNSARSPSPRNRPAPTPATSRPPPRRPTTAPRTSSTAPSATSPTAASPTCSR